jgi:hypothetical protein
MEHHLLMAGKSTKENMGKYDLDFFGGFSSHLKK